ncbi:hypothetical protein MRB53_001231 [Persea americana]|uniref:Uncharacterized protein n=1 Tax=Persea americana TaxID=3435 RepID=A0ACC2MS40_PERAE|nr:hypothetical protein MRB53_001231 [Persea americana]
MLRFGSSLDQTNKPEDGCNCSSQARLLRRTVAKHSVVVHLHRKAVPYRLLGMFATYPTFPVFLLSEGRKAGNCSFTADGNGRKAAISRYPPLGQEECWKCSFTADESSGKAAIARFPPLGVEEDWKMRVCRRCRLRFGSSLDQTNKPEDGCNCSSQARLLRRTVAKHSVVVHLHRKAVPYRLLGMFATYPTFPVFLLSEGRKAGNCSFTADGNGRKAAISRYPPLGQEKCWKCSFTADESSGKAAIARFPPLGVEEDWKMRVCRRCRLRFGSSLDQTNKPEDGCNCSSQARLLRRTVAKHSVVVHLHRKAVPYRLLGMFAKGRKAGNCSFIADGNGRKAAISRYPPLGQEECWKCSFTADESSGKAAIARFPPLGVEEDWKMRVCRRCRLRFGSSLDQTNKPEDGCNCSSQARLLRRTVAKHSVVVHLHRKAVPYRLLGMFATYPTFPVFLLSEGRKAGNCSFTADGNGRKAAISRYPPLGQEECWKCSFTADESSGKAAIARFPPLGVEEDWKMRVCRRCRLRFGSSLDQTNKPEDGCNCSSQARLLRRTVAKHSVVVHLHRKAVPYRLLGMFATYPTFPVFLLSEGRKAGNCSFTADGNGRKAAISRYPPLGQEECWKCSFTADESSGKAAIARFPPLGVEEDWKMRVCRRCRLR